MVAGPPLKCQTPADVYLLLKSSDFIAHDLDHAFEGCCDDGLAESIGNFEIKEQDSSPLRRGFEFELVLKKWFDMPKSQEWRCFVRDDTLIGQSIPSDNSPGFDAVSRNRTTRLELLRVPAAGRSAAGRQGEDRRSF